MEFPASGDKLKITESLAETLVSHIPHQRSCRHIHKKPIRNDDNLLTQTRVVAEFGQKNGSLSSLFCGKTNKTLAITTYSVFANIFP